MKKRAHKYSTSITLSALALAQLDKVQRKWGIGTRSETIAIMIDRVAQAEEKKEK